MERERIDQIFWMLDDYLNELSYALCEVTLKEDEESLEEKVAEVAEVIDYLDGLLAVGPRPNRVVVDVETGLGNAPYIFAILAERPGEIVVIERDNFFVGEPGYQGKVWGGPDGEPIGKLNTMKEEADDS